MDSIGGLGGRTAQVIRSPAKMVPHASRLRGLVIDLMFSLIGERAGNRGKFMFTKKIIRKLYAAVREVARRVRARAQALR